MEIVDGGRHFRAGLATIAKVGHLSRLAGRVKVVVPDTDKVATDKPVAAQINRNRWVVLCPDCYNAEFAFLGEPLFFCSNCFNGAVGRLWRPVVFPKNRAAIEAAIKARPLPASRNWSPGETVAQLRRENKEHGLPEEVV